MRAHVNRTGFVACCTVASLAPILRAAESPTFSHDIAPLLYAECAQCHRPGQVAPFALLTYDDVKKRGKQMVEVLQSRFMPPWMPEPSDGCVSMVGERRLSADQINMVRQWVDDGMKEGDPQDLPPVPRFDDNWPLGEPDLVLTLPEPYIVPADTKDTIRTFVVPVSLPHAEVVKAVDFRPGNPRTVHHASFLVDLTGTAKMLDDEDPLPGYRGMGDIGLNLAGSFGVWSPGNSATKFPDGIGRFMPKQCHLSVEVHFNPTGKPEPVQPLIALYFVRENIDHRVVNASLGSFFLDIPANENAYIIKDSMTLPVATKLLSVTPHAHYLCRHIILAAALPDGTSIPLLKINDWDFNWQQEFRYREPIELPAGSKLEMEYVYDNTAGNPRNPNAPPKRVRTGSNASDEMALAFFTLVASNERELPHLEQAKNDKLLELMKQAQLKRAESIR